MFADRVYETSTSTGTGTFTLSGAAPGCRTFSAALGTAQTYYLIVNRAVPTEWEVGSFTVSGSSMARIAASVIQGSGGAGVLVSFSAGTKDIYQIAPSSAILKKTGGTLTGQLAGTTFQSTGTATTTGFKIGNGTDLASIFAPGGFATVDTNRNAGSTGSGIGTYKSYSLEAGSSPDKLRLAETTVQYAVSYCSYCTYCTYCA